MESELVHAGLPPLGVDRNQCALFTYVDAGGGIAGYAALQGNGEDLLIRSVVVPAAHRGKGVGAALVKDIAAEAYRRDARRLWLLTTTAEKFFTTLGYETVPRASAPDSITRTNEFTEACPASAVCMKFELGAA